MEALARSAVLEHSKMSSQEVAAALLSILQQYPSGLTAAVIATQLQSTLQGGRRRKRRSPGDDAACDAGPPAAASATQRDQQPLWWRRAPLPAQPLSAVLDGRRRRVFVYAEVCRPTDPSTSSSSAAAGAVSAKPAALAAPTLQLSDGSTKEPVALFLHSALLPLLGGPAFEAGACVRCSATAVPPLPGLAHLPPLMPTLQLVVEVPLQRLGEVTFGGGPSPVHGLRQTLARVAAALAAGSGAACVDGWVTARVAHVGELEDGAAWHAHAVRAVTLADAGLDGQSTAEDGPAADEAAAAAAAAAAAEGGGAVAVTLVLRDDQTALGDLLLPGEAVAFLGAALQRVDGGAGRPAVVLGDRWACAALQQAGAAADAAAAAGEAAAADAAADAAGKPGAAAAQVAHHPVMPPLDSLQPGAEGLVLMGRVQGLRLKGGRQLLCTLAQAGGGGGGDRTVPLRMQLAGGARSKALLHQLREGHTVLLVGARTAAAASPADAPAAPGDADATKQQPVAAAQVEWDESWPDAVAQDVSCLAAVLTTPALQDGLVMSMGDLVTLLDQLEQQQQQQQQEQGQEGTQQHQQQQQQQPAIVEACVAAAEVKAVKVHAACGRPVSRASFGFGCLVDGDEDGEEEGAAAADGGKAEEAIGEELDGGALWECGFCGVECSGAETEAAWAGGVALAAGGVGSGGGEAAAGGSIRVVAEPLVWRTLLPFTADQWRRLPADAAKAQVDRAVVGRKCRFSLLLTPPSCGRDRLTATQVKLL